MKIIECVPNFSEGQNLTVINQITDEIKKVEGVTLLDVDPGFDTNRTVVTLVGEPEPVLEAAFQAIKKASEVIDMRKHHGAHARMGATDVCPLVPVAGVTMEECIQHSHTLAKRVGEELGISVFLYEHSATKEERKNLATVRAGEYEGMAEKIQTPEWKPDYGPTKLNETAGVTAIGARDFLIAYNINLNSKDTAIAKDIALDIREQGRRARDENGKLIRDKNRKFVRQEGKLKCCKAVGWFIDEYNVAQVSMNLTNFNVTPVHRAFEEVREGARTRGARVTGSELVGLIPLKAILSAGEYYLAKQGRTAGIPEKEIIHIAVKSLGLDDLTPFDPKEKIIEYRIKELYGPLASMRLHEFADETSSDSPAPGGGSVSAYAGAMGAALASMVGNLTMGKKKWQPLFPTMDQIACEGQKIKDELLGLIDEDTEAFNKVIDAMRLPKKTEAEISARNTAIEQANKHATHIPMRVLKLCARVLPLAHEAVLKGNPNSVSDAGVAAEMAAAGANGAAMNVLINLKGIEDEAYCAEMNQQTDALLMEIENQLKLIREDTWSRLKS
ncbi:MAG: glutamate formimidoyltransferase [Acidobacteria bacterium]|nr:MAG: glutamate formimidoyltransferase [Acidobacteriota bacterium]